jgi:glycosyltransferase involved in cell wall biosynthesis
MVSGGGNLTRVAFVFAFDGSWLGGINYFRNLLSAVCGLSSRQIVPIIFTGKSMPVERFNGFPPLEIVRSRLFDRYSLPWMIRKVLHIFLKNDYLLERLLIKHQVTVLSHSVHMGAYTRIPTIGWIPDFQHRRMPEFFSESELATREKEFSKILACDRVIVSSFDAKKDLINYYSRFVDRSRVLEFVADMDLQIYSANIDQIREKYSITTPYFHLPNQFWIHKNHYIVIDALKLLKERGIRVTVIATGNQSDHRQLYYFKSLMAHVQSCGVQEDFRVIGVVPYSDLITLMKYSVALINPSYFEGWSTTVEESKSLGKRVILSDIPIHREQSPLRGVYFDPRNPESLALAIEQELELWSLDDDAEWFRRATLSTNIRKVEFAKKYQDIVLELAADITNGIRSSF